MDQTKNRGWEEPEEKLANFLSSDHPSPFYLLKLSTNAKFNNDRPFCIPREGLKSFETVYVPPLQPLSATISSYSTWEGRGTTKSRKKQFCYELWEKVEASTQEQMALIVGPMRNKPHHTHHSIREGGGGRTGLEF